MTSRGQNDNMVGVQVTRCCGRLAAECRCAWEARRRILRQQVMGGNHGPTQQNATSLSIGGRVARATNNSRMTGELIRNMFCKTGENS